MLPFHPKGEKAGHRLQTGVPAKAGIHGSKKTLVLPFLGSQAPLTPGLAPPGRLGAQRSWRGRGFEGIRTAGKPFGERNRKDLLRGLVFSERNFFQPRGRPSRHRECHVGVGVF